MENNQAAEKIKEILKQNAPLLVVVVVAVCIVVSLFSYKQKTYAFKNIDTESIVDTENVGDTEDAEATEITQGNFEIEDGVYKGSANGYNGLVTVSVTIVNKSITAIDILSTSDDDAFFNRAKGVIDKIIGSQSLDVDVVSGATYSSNGIIKAVKNALTGETDTESTGASQQSTSSSGSAVIEKVADASQYKDGTYYGTGKGFAGTIKVRVDISGGKISAINIESTSDGSSYIKSASSILDKIIETQSTNVDAVSGATFSSKGIIEAVRSALSQAAVTSDGSSTTGTSSTSTESTQTETVTGTLPYTDGIYYGTAEGYNGDITVAIVIQDKTLKAILVTDKSDDEPFFTNAMSVLENIMKQQNTDVDTVSGATYSSNGLLGAVKNAFEEARKVTNGEKTNTDEKTNVDTTALEAAVAEAKTLSENESSYETLSYYLVKIRIEDANEVLADENKTQTEVDKAISKLKLAINSIKKNDSSENLYNDGTYEITQLCTPDSEGDFTSYNLSMKVTIANDKIVSITDVAEVENPDGSGNKSYINKAVNGTKSKASVVSQITAKGIYDSLNDNSIDVVSGATCTSNAIINGCIKAFEQASKTASAQ